MIGERVLTVIEDRMMVPWYPGELNQVEEQGLNFGLPVDCTHPLFLFLQGVDLGPLKWKRQGRRFS
jgi:hypothetical protein